MRLAILDLDGTVYRGSEPIAGAAEAVRALLEEGVLVRYLTNNSAAVPSAVAAKLQAMAVPCEPDWVYGTGPEAVRTLQERGWDRVLAVGEPSLLQMLREAGIDPEAKEPQAVLTGICRTFDYAMLSRAMTAVLAGAHWIATNRDGSYPREGGRLEPGAGAMAAALQACTGVEPETLGKPEPRLVLRILEETGIAASDAVMVGDRPETDLEAGRRAGTRTWLVLTGVATGPIPGQDGSPNILGLVENLRVKRT